MRLNFTILLACAAVAFDAGAAPKAPPLDVAFPVISTAPPDSWLFRQMAERKGVDYVAILKTERPVSHHTYLYERRRSGNWTKNVWRRPDGTSEGNSYFNVKTGASVDVQRDKAGQIVSVTVAQRDDYRWDRRVPTGEDARHLGERCSVWRSQSQGPGTYIINESCVTDDGIELWSRARSSGGQALGSPVVVSSLSRKQVDPSTARPPQEAFDWAYWRARIASGRANEGRKRSARSQCLV